jgi:hypothetical protein
MADRIAAPILVYGNRRNSGPWAVLWPRWGCRRRPCMRTTSSQRLATATLRSNTPAAQTWRQTLRPQPVQACRLCTLSPCECCTSICFDRPVSVPHLLGRSHMSASADVRLLLDVQSLPWKSICARTRCGRRCASSSATATTCRRLPPADRSWRPQLSPKRPTLQTSGCGAPRYVVMHVAHRLGDKHWPHPLCVSFVQLLHTCDTMSAICLHLLRDWHPTDRD